MTNFNRDPRFVFTDPARVLEELTDSEDDAGSLSQGQSSNYNLEEPAPYFGGMTTTVLRQLNSTVTAIKSKLCSLEMANETLTNRFERLEQEQQLPTPPSSSSSSPVTNQSSSILLTSPKITRRITGRISQAIQRVHSNLPDEKKFDLNKSLLSPENQQTRKNILDEVHLHMPEERNELLILGTKRLFENLKRKRRFAILTDEQNTSRKLTSRKRQRRIRKYENRASQAKSHQGEMFRDIGVDHMTEESETEDPVTRKTKIVLHKLPWRSNEATELLHTLDRKYEETLTNKPYRTSKLDRIDGAPSARMPPRGTASWIISSTWQET